MEYSSELGDRIHKNQTVRLHLMPTPMSTLHIMTIQSPATLGSPVNGQTELISSHDRSAKRLNCLQSLPLARMISSPDANTGCR